MSEYTARRAGERTVRLRGTSPDEGGTVLVRSRASAPLNNLEVVERLCAASPALSATCRQHVRGLGSIVPHVFMADVLARVGACMTAETVKGRTALRPEVVAILAVLEIAAISADIDTRRVIASSFVNAGERLKFFAKLRPMLGIRLAAMGTAPVAA
jgi:hypothetical protein